MGLFDAIFGSDEQTVTQQLPPVIENAMRDNLETATFLTDPFVQTQPTAAVAGFTPDQMAGMQALRLLVDDQIPKQYGGARAMNIADTFTAPQVTAGQAGGDMSAYLNPFNSLVRDDALQAIDDRQADTMAQVRRQSAASSAFGGSGNAIMKAQMMRQFDQDRQRTANLMNQQGFNTAMQMQQSDMARDLQAQLANQNAAFQTANTQLGAINQAGLSQTRQLNDDMAAINALLGIGGQQQALNQNALNTPFNMLNVRTGTLSGSPYSTTTTQEGGGPGFLNQAIGTGVGAGVIGNLFGLI